MAKFLVKVGAVYVGLRDVDLLIGDVLVGCSMVCRFTQNDVRL